MKICKFLFVSSCSFISANDAGSSVRQHGALQSKLRTNKLFSAVFERKEGEVLTAIDADKKRVLFERDYDGRTPLNVAAAHSTPNIFWYVLSNYANRENIMWVDSDGNTIWHELIYSMLDDKFLYDDDKTFCQKIAFLMYYLQKILELSREQCAIFLNTKNSNGQSPLQVAVTIARPIRVHKLLELGAINPCTDLENRVHESFKSYKQKSDETIRLLNVSIRRLYARKTVADTKSNTADITCRISNLKQQKNETKQKLLDRIRLNSQIIKLLKDFLCLPEITASVLITLRNAQSTGSAGAKHPGETFKDRQAKRVKQV